MTESFCCFVTLFYHTTPDDDFFIVERLDAGFDALYEGRGGDGVDAFIPNQFRLDDDVVAKCVVDAVLADDVFVNPDTFRGSAEANASA